MNDLYVSIQKIRDNRNAAFAYELIFKDISNRHMTLSNSLKATSQLIINSMQSSEIEKLLRGNVKAFINVDEKTLTKGILDVLDNKRFVFNILEDITLTEDVITKIVFYKKRGFLFSLEHFDSSARMLVKFQRLFNYIDIIKMDIILSEESNLQKVMQKFKSTHIKLLAQGVDSYSSYEDCLALGFDLFQGSYIDAPHIMELAGSKEPTQMVIMQLIKIIKGNNSTEELEFFIKQQADLSFKLIAFFNNLEKVDIQIESLTQVITLLGRNKLLRWLVIYLYSEVSKNSASKTMLDLAIRRAESMEAEAEPSLKDKAYLAGMFSMLSSIFDTDIKELMDKVKLDSDITMLVLHKKGIFASSLMRAELAEKTYLKKKMLENFEKISTTDLIYALEDSGIDINKDDI